MHHTSTSSLTLRVCLILFFLLHAHGLSISRLFGGGSETETPTDFNATSSEIYNPVVVKTMQAVLYVVQPENSTTANGTVVPFGVNGSSQVLVRRDSLNSLFLSFQHDSDEGVNTWATNSTRVPFLNDFVYTAEAPAALVDTFSQLTGIGGNISGPLTQAIMSVMQGERILWVTCTGEGAGGGLAILCGVASGLHFPATSVNVITFATPWQGFNTQFSWTFDRLISLYYFWPFNATSVASPLSISNITTNDPAALAPIAQTLNTLITSSKETLPAALTIPNLPPPLPQGATELKKDNVILPNGTYDENVQACENSFLGQPNPIDVNPTPVCVSGSPKIKSLGVWAPAPSLPPPAMLPPTTPCPPIICRSVPYLEMSCTGFKLNSTALGGLPSVPLQDAKTGGDAIVAWNETRKEAILLFKYTNETRDWVANALAYRTDDFRKRLDEEFPAIRGITNAVGDPQVHAGFYAQFSALIAGDGKDPSALNLTSALHKLNGGQSPLFISISGFSLGGALSELAAVWASIKWPRANVLVATQGAPKVGNFDFVELFKATAGVSMRFQYNLDEVPSLPPLPGYRTTRQPVWVTSAGGGGGGGENYVTLLQPRPDIDLDLTTWYDHWCEVFYVPILKNATSVAIPSWVYTAQAA